MTPVNTKGTIMSEQVAKIQALKSRVTRRGVIMASATVAAIAAGGYVLFKMNQPIDVEVEVEIEETDD